MLWKAKHLRKKYGLSKRGDLTSTQKVNISRKCKVKNAIEVKVKCIGRKKKEEKYEPDVLFSAAIEIK